MKELFPNQMECNFCIYWEWAGEGREGHVGAGVGRGGQQVQSRGWEGGRCRVVA